ncbi:hypothetical protein KFE96_11930 [Kordiimonas sp. SCSIO 12603]|uniref:hypothetical protein n=1 Tax=Kordiimonas sp. SCSIO 12603 TaxID=2829596 RepID=UPI0021083BA6|nr:hypothetical protein [Kordiimonas sp. SCSIO 12603]UTW57547.1 hypothetical protein KFE96_11930 [Kordiimonas sp. SCSIO 12603]
MSEDAVDDEGGGSGKVLLILGLVLGVGIGGGAGYFMSGSGGEGAPAEAEEKVEEMKPKGDLLPIDIEKLTVPIYSMRNNSRRFIGNFFVDVRLQVYGQEKQIAVKRAETQLQHAFLSAMSRADLMVEGSTSDIDFDKAAMILKSRADEILGADIVENVSIIKSVRMGR